MDDDHETAWADINPPMASAPRPAPPSTSSASRLAPASAERFRNELTACLALVAPVGMDEPAKREWLAIAWETLKHLPADILSIGAKAARGKCDHPSKIVPAILAETEELMRWRKTAAKPRPEFPQIEAPRPCTPEAAREIMEELGIPTFDAKRPEPRPLRKPTRQDYIALGVDPAVLDQIARDQ